MRRLIASILYWLYLKVRPKKGKGVDPTNPLELLRHLSEDVDEWIIDPVMPNLAVIHEAARLRAQGETDSNWGRIAIEDVEFRMHDKAYSRKEIQAVNEIVSDIRSRIAIRKAQTNSRAYYEQKIAEYDAEQEHEGAI